jgi:hypothetical protein
MRNKEESMHSTLVFGKGEAHLLYEGSLRILHLGIVLCIGFGGFGDASSQISGEGA